MDRIQYKAIRGERDFLYRYFVKMGGKPIGDQQFSQLLSFWLLSMGIPPQQGIPIIVNFLDKKFA